MAGGCVVGGAVVGAAVDVGASVLAGAVDFLVASEIAGLAVVDDELGDTVVSDDAGVVFATSWRAPTAMVDSLVSRRPREDISVSSAPASNRRLTSTSMSVTATRVSLVAGAAASIVTTEAPSDRVARITGSATRVARAQTARLAGLNPFGFGRPVAEFQCDGGEGRLRTVSEI